MTADHQLSAAALHLGYGGAPVIRGLDLDVPAGRVTSIIGPNGCGKSTLLRSMSRLLRPSGGAMTLDGRAVHTIPGRELATVLGILPQTPLAPEGITVSDLVGRGRHPHQGLFARWTARDEAAVHEALEATRTVELADAPVDELSGGQRQRVWIAMALAQQTDVLLLDEPTTFLDICHQIEVLDLLEELNRTRGTTIVMVLHDLNLAARYSDHLVVLREGGLRAAGAPADVLDARLVLDVFGIDSRIITDPVSGGPLMIPVGPARTGTEAAA